jgi:hypothetical protein
MDLDRLHAEVLYSQVRVKTTKSGGSGTIIYSEAAEDGVHHTYAITCHHVVEEAISIKAEWDSRVGRERKREIRQLVTVEFFDWSNVLHGHRPLNWSSDAEVVAYDKDHDMALLKLRTVKQAAYVARVMAPGDEKAIRIGSPCTAVGCALLHDPVLTGGIITHMGDEIDGKLYWMCHSADTEVLARDGWKPISGVVEGEEIVTWNEQRNVLEYQPVHKLYKYEHDGLMYDVSGKQGSCLVSANHRFMYRNDPREKWSVASSEELFGSKPERYVEVPVTAPFETDRKLNISDDFLRLLGWVITEGNFCTRSDNVRISQSTSANPQKVQEIERLLRVLQIKASFYDLERGRRTWVIEANEGREIRAMIPEKRLTRQLLGGCSVDQLRVLFEAMIDGDGSRDEGRPSRFYTKEYVDASLFQELAVKLGYRTSLNYMPSWTCWHVYISSKRKTCYVHSEPTHYQGRIYGVEVANGYTLTRREGRPIITHNSNAQIIFGNSGGAVFTPGAEGYEFLGIPSRIAIAGWSSPITHLGYFSPITRVHEFFKEQAYDFLTPGSNKTERECEVERAKIKEREERKLIIEAPAE